MTLTLQQLIDQLTDAQKQYGPNTSYYVNLDHAKCGPDGGGGYQVCGCR
ncbi:hypothetical protein [Kitasatospora aureofaciens]